MGGLFFDLAFEETDREVAPVVRLAIEGEKEFATIAFGEFSIDKEIEPQIEGEWIGEFFGHDLFLRVLLQENVAKFLSGAEESHLDDAGGDTEAAADFMVAAVIHVFEEQHFEFLDGELGHGDTQLSVAFR